MAEGLLHDEPSTIGKSGGVQPSGDGREETRRNGKVVDGVGGPAEFVPEAGERLRVVEVAGYQRHPLAQPIENRAVDVDLRRDQRVVRAPVETVGIQVRPRDADDRTGQLIACLHRIERREQHLERQVAGDAEQHKRIGRLQFGAHVHPSKPLDVAPKPRHLSSTLSRGCGVDRTQRTADLSLRSVATEPIALQGECAVT